MKFTVEELTKNIVDQFQGKPKTRIWYKDEPSRKRIQIYRNNQIVQEFIVGY